MSEFKKYPKIPALGYDGTENILDGNVIVQPKIDGSNVSIWFGDGEIKLGRREAFLKDDEKSFAPFITWAREQFATNEKWKSLADANTSNGQSPIVLFGEYSNNQNKLKYNSKVPFVLFDVAYLSPDGEEGLKWKFAHYNIRNEYDLDASVLDFANLLSIPVVPALYDGPGAALTGDKIVADYLGKESILGGPNEEGVVVKNYGTSNRFGGLNFAKLVTAEFRERQNVKIRNPQADTGIGQWARDTFLNKARVHKAIQKLKEEGRWDDQQARKNIGPLIGVVTKDIQDEHLEEIHERALKIIWKECSAAISKDVVTVLDEIMMDNSKEEDHADSTA